MTYASPPYIASPGGLGGSGTNGADGLSAYELAVQEGFVGTLEEWLASLEGPPFFNQETTPTTSVEGARWYKPSDGVCYTYFLDGSSYVWAEL